MSVIVGTAQVEREEMRCGWIRKRSQGLTGGSRHRRSGVRVAVSAVVRSVCRGLQRDGERMEHRLRLARRSASCRGRGAIFSRSDVDVPKLPLMPMVIVLGGSAIGLAVVILRWLSLPRGGGGLSGVSGYSYGGRFGIWVAVIAGIVQVACALALFANQARRCLRPTTARSQSSLSPSRRARNLLRPPRHNH